MRRVALSLRQPWAWAVVHAGKNIENRTWSTKFRGEFFIHAAKGMNAGEFEEASYFIGDAKGWHWSTLATRIPGAKALERGGIIGKARLVDVIPQCAPPEFAGGKCACGQHPWHIGTQFGFVLADVVALPFEPCVGKLGFFDPDAKSDSWKGVFR